MDKVKKVLSVVAVMAACFVLSTNASDTFTSLTSIKQLFHQEGFIVKIINEALNSRINEANRIKTKLQETWQNNQRLKEEDLKVHLHHPTNTFHLIKRWYNIREKLQDMLDIEALERNLGLALPDINDYHGAVAAIVRIQKTHRVTTAHMKSGQVNGEHGQPIEDDGDFIAIAKHAWQLGSYGLAMKWINGVRDTLLQVVLGCSHLGDDDAEQCVNKYDYEWTSVDSTNTLKYQELCRGDMVVAESKKALLYCQYKKGHNIPFGIYKEEVHNIDPHVAIFYDVISETEAEYVINAALPEMQIGYIGNSSRRDTSSARVSKVGWLWDHDERVKKLTTRIGDVTGLNVEWKPFLSPTEPMQIVNYGIGGQYEPHLDYCQDPSFLESVHPSVLNTGDRISTFLFYLSHARLGGATVFPHLNVRVPPVKNGAAFWYNYLPNGHQDPRTLHAGCPVVLGEKWVANKWIRERGQEFHRPCPLDENAIDG